jgi:putative redox protein
MAKEHTAQAVLVGPMRFDAESGSGNRIVMDVGEQDGGQNAGPSPMELLLVALAGCTGMDVISILRKKRQDVTDYTISVRGVRREEYPQTFTAITVEHTVTGRSINPDAVQRAIELSETKYCSVGATLGMTATITHTFRVEEA